MMLFKTNKISIQGTTEFWSWKQAKERQHLCEKIKLAPVKSDVKIRTIKQYTTVLALGANRLVIYFIVLYPIINYDDENMSAEKKSQKLESVGTPNQYPFD